MKLKRLFRSVYFVIALFCLPTACVRDQMDTCMQYMLRIKVADVDGNDLTGTGAVGSIDLYLFNEQGFVRKIPAGQGFDFSLNYDKSEKLTFVGWGNLRTDSLEVPTLAVGTSLEEAQLSLRTQADGTCIPVPDLFYGRLAIAPQTATRSIAKETLTLVLERCVAGMSVRTNCLANRFGNSSEPCHFIVRATNNALNFMEKSVGTDAGYQPASVTNALGDAYAAPFRILPTREQHPIEVDIYRGNTKLFTVTEDAAGKPLYALPGRQLNVNVDFCSAASINVTVIVTPWGEVSQDTEI